MPLIPKAFEPQAELDEIRSKLTKTKLDANDRVVLAMNLGSFWKDANRYFPDFTMRALFFETFGNADAAESAYKKRHSFIWLSEEVDHRKPSELRSGGQAYLQFITALIPKLLITSKLSAAEKNEIIFKQLISGTSFDFQGAARDRQQLAFKNEVDLRFSQLIDKIKDTIDLNWWFEWVDRANLPGVTLGLKNDELSDTAPCVKIAAIHSEANIEGVVLGAQSITINFQIEEESEGKIPDKSDLELSYLFQSIVIDIFSDEEMLDEAGRDKFWPRQLLDSASGRKMRPPAEFRDTKWLADEDVERLINDLAEGTDDWKNEQQFNKYIQEKTEKIAGKKSWRTFDPTSVTNRDILSCDLAQIWPEAVNSTDHKIFEGFKNKTPKFSYSTIFSKMVQSNLLDLEIRYDEEDYTWKPVLLWKRDLEFANSPNSESQDGWLKDPNLLFIGDIKLIPLFEYFGEIYSPFRIYIVLEDTFQLREGKQTFPLVALNHYDTFWDTKFGLLDDFSARESDYEKSVSYISQHTFSPPDPNFYELLFKQASMADGRPGDGSGWNGSHYIESSLGGVLSETVHTGAIAPGGTLASDLLSNFAFAAEDKRVDQMLINDALKKYNAHRKLFKEQQVKYLEAINRNLGGS